MTMDGTRGRGGHELAHQALGLENLAYIDNRTDGTAPNGTPIGRAVLR